MTLACAVPVVGLGCSGEPRREDRDGGDGADAGPGDLGPDPFAAPGGTTLSAARFATLAAAMDALVPGSEASPGATIANAAWYLDQLLGAFSIDPPRIFAGGPYSGRHGGVDGFHQLQPLTRVEQLRWRTYLEGSRGIPEREWNGPVEGLLARYERELDVLDATARERTGSGMSRLDLRTRTQILGAYDPAVVQLVYEHAVEGTYGDPVYGGNAAFAGWRAIDFEGDRQPIGYTARQMAHPEEG